MWWLKCVWRVVARRLQGGCQSRGKRIPAPPPFQRASLSSSGCVFVLWSANTNEHTHVHRSGKRRKAQKGGPWKSRINSWRCLYYRGLKKKMVKVVGNTEGIKEETKVLKSNSSCCVVSSISVFVDNSRKTVLSNQIIWSALRPPTLQLVPLTCCHIFASFEM